MWLQWIDKEGKTPLIVACMNPGLYDVAKTLIELGARVDAYRPGTPFFTIGFDMNLIHFVCLRRQICEGFL